MSFTELAMFRHYPATRRLPHVALGNFPTPVRKLERLGPKFGLHELWVKHDDQSGTLYGGNKVRKLEFLLGEALALGKEKVLTIGAVGSHHVLATCLYARSLGLVPAAQHWPQPVTPHVLENLRALSTTTPELVLMPHITQLPFRLFKQRAMDWLLGDPSMHYIAGGGSSPLGVLGYVNAMVELWEQAEQGELPLPEAIVVAAGTTGTLGGIALGVKMLGLPITVYGVRVVERVVTNVVTTLRLANKAAGVLRDLGLEVPSLGLGDVQILEGHYGQGYGIPTQEGVALADQAQNEEGLTLDPTYTAKAFAALPALAATSAHRRVLYWHTLSGVDLGALGASAEPFEHLPKSYHAFFGPQP